ncbi:hypothetical protein LSM04_005054 [Trypanosoma melophagium]|uniref:uncharacterized protein n=1 Tax=Trypanosoma melophagium TaxID=715481 RepID=UPI00351A0485|nr:hypothetical protein LSM04_005054 [Trypanosoma melophagium]
MEKKYPHRNSQIQLASNVAEKGMDLMDNVYPMGEKIYEKILTVSTTVQQQRFSQLFPTLLGFAICFFGGCFPVFITLVEVLNLTSWERIKKNVYILYENYLAARSASKRDDMVDADNNGIPDVQEIPRNELFSRKLKVFLNSVDTAAVKEAVNALILAFLAIKAALHDKMSAALAFGCSIANIIKQFSHLERFLEDNLPPDQKKLAGTISSAILSFICMFITALFQKYALAAYCAARGANMIVDNGLALRNQLALADGKEKKNTALTIESPQIKTLITFLTVVGFLWQAYIGFSLPFPINILLLPFTLADWILGIVFLGSAGLMK